MRERINFMGRLILLNIGILMCCLWCPGCHNPKNSDETFFQNYQEQHRSELHAHPTIPGLYLDSVAIKLLEDYFIPLSNPIWYESKAADYMRLEDVVIGIVIDSQAYAFPWWILKNHHIANVTIGGHPLVVTLCEMCSDAACFSAARDTNRHIFFQEGLYQGTWFMRDSETNSYWLPFNGECFYGSAKGAKLDFVQSFQTSWQEWLLEYPYSKVLFDLEEKRHGHGAQEFPGSNRIAGSFEKSLVQPIQSIDNPFDLVLGVDFGNVHKSYELKKLDMSKNPVFQETVQDSLSVVIFHKPGTYFAGAYDPELDTKVLHFEFRNNRIIDTESSSVWNLAGLCIEGRLKGHKLRPYEFGIKEKYAWFNYYPKSLNF